MSAKKEIHQMYSKGNVHRVFCVAALTFCASAAFGQSEMQLRVRQLPGWDVRAREGRCDVRVWVDNRAEVRLRGDAVFVRTLEGSKGRDEGSQCSQPLPFNNVRDFQLRQTGGRSRITLTQEPSRSNNYTAMVGIDDTQGGGDTYSFEVTWHAEADVEAAPAPFFDDVRACQDAVRQRFQAQNERGSYIDFNSFAERQGQGQDQYRGQGQNRFQDQRRDRGQNRGQESIQGKGSARTRSETRDLTYSCVVDTRLNQVVSGSYQLTGESLRMNNGRYSGRQLR